MNVTTSESTTVFHAGPEPGSPISKQEKEQRNLQAKEIKKRQSRVIGGLAIFAFMVNGLLVGAYTFLGSMHTSIALQNHFILFALHAEAGGIGEVSRSVEQIQPLLQFVQLSFISGLAWCGTAAAFGLLFFVWGIQPKSRVIKIALKSVATLSLVACFGVIGYSHLEKKHVGGYAKHLLTHSSTAADQAGLTGNKDE